MKSTKRHFTLGVGEYLITGQHPTGRDYEVYYKGKKIHDVMGVIRMVIEKVEDKKRE